MATFKFELIFQRPDVIADPAVSYVSQKLGD
jgi:hypothetical protein